MPTSNKAIPDGYHSVTPYLIIDGAAAALDFYKKAFGATEVMRLPMGDKIVHAEIKIGDSHVDAVRRVARHGSSVAEEAVGTSVSMIVVLRIDRGLL